MLVLPTSAPPPAPIFYEPSVVAPWIIRANKINGQGIALPSSAILAGEAVNLGSAGGSASGGLGPDEDKPVWMPHCMVNYHGLRFDRDVNYMVMPGTASLFANWHKNWLGQIILVWSNHLYPEAEITGAQSPIVGNTLASDQKGFSFVYRSGDGISPRINGNQVSHVPGGRFNTGIDCYPGSTNVTSIWADGSRLYVRNNCGQAVSVALTGTRDTGNSVRDWAFGYSDFSASQICFTIHDFFGHATPLGDAASLIVEQALLNDVLRAGVPETLIANIGDSTTRGSGARHSTSVALQIILNFFFPGQYVVSNRGIGARVIGVSTSPGSNPSIDAVVEEYIASKVGPSIARRIAIIMAGVNDINNHSATAAYLLGYLQSVTTKLNAYEWEVFFKTILPFDEYQLNNAAQVAVGNEYNAAIRLMPNFLTDANAIGADSTNPNALNHYGTDKPIYWFQDTNFVDEAVTGDGLHPGSKCYSDIASDDALALTGKTIVSLRVPATAIPAGAVPPTPSIWTPENPAITSLVGWLKPDISYSDIGGVTLATNGQQVASIRDPNRGGLGTQTVTSRRPILTSNVVGGRPGWLLDPTLGTCFNISSIFASSITSNNVVGYNAPFTFIGAFIRNELASTTRIIFCASTNAATGAVPIFSFEINTSTFRCRRAGNIGTLTRLGAPQKLNNLLFHVLTFQFDGVNLSCWMDDEIVMDSDPIVTAGSQVNIDNVYYGAQFRGVSGGVPDGVTVLPASGYGLEFAGFSAILPTEHRRNVIYGMRSGYGQV